MNIETLDRANYLKSEIESCDRTLKDVDRALEFTTDARADSVSGYIASIQRKHVCDIHVKVERGHIAKAILDVKNKLTLEKNRLEEELKGL